MRHNLKNARLKAGMTQQQVADYLHVSLRHYKFMEAGTVTGNVTLWDALEDRFHVHQRVLRETSPGPTANQLTHKAGPPS